MPEEAVHKAALLTTALLLASLRSTQPIQQNSWQRCCVHTRVRVLQLVAMAELRQDAHMRPVEQLEHIENKAAFISDD